MPLAALEEVRLLSNLESSRHKLLQIVLFGQPELDQRLGEPALRQLNDRITHHFRLEPLHPNDIAAYLMFRLRAAGYHGPDLFTRRAIQLISRASEGLTRRINILADKALLAAFSEGVHQIDGRQVRAAIRDAQFKRIADPARARWLWVGVSTALCALGGLAYLASGNNAGGLPTAAANKATTLAPATLRETESSVMSTMAEPEPTFSRTATLGTAKLDTLAERIAATEVWLAQTPDSHYFIQLLMTDAGSQREISDFIVNHKRTLDLRQLRVYRSRFGGRERLGIIYGDYPSREQANAALATLGEVSQESKPYVRAVAKLRSSQLGRLE